MDGAIVICALLPRFELTVAANGRKELLGLPVAVAPRPGSQQIGEVSAAAEAFGIHRGMRLGEALSRCPHLRLVPGDPAGAEQLWEAKLAALEAIGAAVEPLRLGLACFDAQGLLRLYGGGIETVVATARDALAMPVRLGAAPTRFAAIAAATRTRPRRSLIVEGDERAAAAFLAPLPVALLRTLPPLAELPVSLGRLGIATLGELAALPVAAVVDRFGSLGLIAHRLASGHDRALRPRAPWMPVEEELSLPEAIDGAGLEHAAGMLIDRLLASPLRGGRALRAATLSAVLVEGGGTWHGRVVFREALGDPLRIRLALSPRLREIPAPVQALRLTATDFGPVAAAQRPLIGDPARLRAQRLHEAVQQVRTVAGAEGALRVLPIDPDSRLPERRAVLTPFER